MLCVDRMADYNQSMKGFFARISQTVKKNEEQRSVVQQADAKLGIGELVNGRYRLDEELGRGGMGVVYRACDLQNQCDVAVKIIHDDLLNERSIQQFLREAEFTARLDHPHIVSIREHGTTEAEGISLPFLVMELVTGITLDEVGVLTYVTIIDIAKQICEALHFAHTQGYIYRDLKPANVMLEKRGFKYFVKLMDFGLARPRDEAYAPDESTLAGTSFYLAPELIAGHPADIASDLYALGITLYEMITGRVPFYDIDESNIITQHVEDVVPPPSQSRSDVLPALEEIVLRLLAKNPKDRFASADDVYRSLEQVALPQDTTSFGNLPKSVFTGSEEDVVKVTQLLESNRLVTLLDANNSLAIAVGNKLNDEFQNGVWLVRFDDINEPRLVLEKVIDTLGIPVSPNRSLAVTLVEWMKEKRALLILDYCDGVLGACSQLVETVLQGCPEVWILATSLQPLGLQFEKSFPE
jgi:serine/threonine-protein kinase